MTFKGNYRYEDGQLFKRCPHCKEWYPADMVNPEEITSPHFGRNISQKFGIASWCKDCNRVRDTESQRSRRKRLRELNKELRAESVRNARQLQSVPAEKLVLEISRMIP